MLSEVTKSKLTIDQQAAIVSIHIKYPDAPYEKIAAKMAEGFIEHGLKVADVLRTLELISPFACDVGGGVWFYSNGYWNPDGQHEVNRRLTLFLGNKFRIDHVNQLVAIIRGRIPQIVGPGPAKLINVKNGMLDWENEKVLDHDPKYFSTYQIPYNWNPGASCPTVDTWFEGTFDSSITNLLWQVIGVTIYPMMGFQKAVVLIGGGFNGKSTYLRLIQRLIPRHFRSAIDIQSMSEDKFACSQLFGKIANICADVEKLTIKSTAIFKSLTGQDEISAQFKGRNRFDFTSQATLLFSGNEMPKSFDDSPGWFRRWLIIPVTNVIVGKADPTLEPRMHLEMEGVLVKAIRGLQDAMAKGGFDEPDICREASERYEFASKSADWFIHDTLEISGNPVEKIGRSVLLKAYTNFCGDKKVEPASSHVLYESLKRIGKGRISDCSTEENGVQDRGFKGVSFSGAPAN